eukprot:746431-Hanusia_phi.AAC.4
MGGEESQGRRNRLKLLLIFKVIVEHSSRRDLIGVLAVGSTVVVFIAGWLAGPRRTGMKERRAPTESMLQMLPTTMAMTRKPWMISMIITVVMTLQAESVPIQPGSHPIEVVLAEKVCPDARARL